MFLFDFIISVCDAVVAYYHRLFNANKIYFDKESINLHYQLFDLINIVSIRHNNKVLNMEMLEKELEDYEVIHSEVFDVDYVNILSDNLLNKTSQHWSLNISKYGDIYIQFTQTYYDWSSSIEFMDPYTTDQLNHYICFFKKKLNTDDPIRYKDIR